MEYKRIYFQEVSKRIKEPRSKIHWRDKKDEVDYVLARRRKVVALEVKTGRRTMNDGLPRFSTLFRPHRSLVVGSGGLGIEEFLTMDLNILFDRL